ncbi:hypothetical protein [Agreia sp.]|uniref:hypothetical protein n=1 Tax=Agreia sp. TaxID=1872416 RepID=UPI0035BBC7E5
MTVAFWICALVTFASAAVSLGYSLVAVRQSRADARTASLYAAARSVSLVVVAVVAPFTGALPFVAAIAIAMIVVQAIDAGIGVAIRDRVKTFGPALTAAANLAALLWMLGSR